MIELDRTMALQWQNEALTVKGQSLFSISEIRTFVFSFCIQYIEVTKYNEVSI